MSTAIGASIPFAHLMPEGFIPAALAQRRALLSGDQLPPNPYTTTGGM